MGMYVGYVIGLVAWVACAVLSAGEEGDCQESRPVLSSEHEVSEVQVAPSPESIPVPSGVVACLEDGQELPSSLR